MQLKVENHPDLVRDPNSKAIINVNRNAMAEHISKQQMKENIKHLNNEITLLKEDFREIKELLQQIACRG